MKPPKLIPGTAGVPPARKQETQPSTVKGNAAWGGRDARGPREELGW